MTTTAPITETDMTPVVPEPVADSQPSQTTSEAFETTFKHIESVMKEFKLSITKLRKLKSEISMIERSLKKHEDRRNRRKRATLDKNGNKRPNGFNIENNLISDELSDFIGHPCGKPISRTEVTRRLTAFVKEHKLQDKDDGRCVNLDSDAGKKLKDLLADVVDKEGNPTRLTIITINKFVNKHYVGKVAPPPPAVVDADAVVTPAPAVVESVTPSPAVVVTPAPAVVEKAAYDTSEKLAASKKTIIKKKLKVKRPATTV